MTAPAAMIAKSAIAHSGRFSEIRTTRSPASTPIAHRKRASAATRPAASSRDTACQAPPLLARNSGLPPSFDVASKNISGRLRQSS